VTNWVVCAFASDAQQKMTTATNLKVLVTMLSSVNDSEKKPQAILKAPPNEGR
jgi:hypothetical protein